MSSRTNATLYTKTFSFTLHVYDIQQEKNASSTLRLGVILPGRPSSTPSPILMVKGNSKNKKR